VYADVRHGEELIVIINNNGHLQEPYILTSRFQHTLEKDELDVENMGIYTIRQMSTDPINGQIS
jgi:hypothetical protein